MVIDYIKGIASSKGSCAKYLQAHPEVIQNTNSLINAARSHQISIFYIRLAFDSNYHALPKFAPNAHAIRNNSLFQLGSTATEFIADIQLIPTDTIINKTYGDVFQGNQLLQQLKKQHIEEIILTGISTDNAILNSANIAIRND